jgi:hypothetical protein
MVSAIGHWRAFFATNRRLGSKPLGTRRDHFKCQCRVCIEIVEWITSIGEKTAEFSEVTVRIDRREMIEAPPAERGKGGRALSGFSEEPLACKI